MTAPVWSFKFGTAASPTTISSDVQAFSIKQGAVIERFLGGTAVLEIDNDDGDWTPSSIGGTGTYANVDWLSQGLWIDCDVDGTTVPVFHGLIVDLVVNDNGTNSRVQISAQDAFKVTGRDTWSPPGGAPTLEFDDRIWEVIFGGDVFLASPCEFPRLGTVSSVSDFTFYSLQNLVGIAIPETSTGMNDIQTAVMPAGPYVAWPTTIEYGTSGAPDEAVYGCTVIGPGLMQDTIEFVDIVEGVPSDGELPLRSARTGLGADQVINQCDVSTNVNGSTPTNFSKADETSQNKYGLRTKSLSGSWALDYSIYSAIDFLGRLNDGMQRGDGPAHFWVNRFSDVDYEYNQIELAEHMVDFDATNTPAAWRRLLSVETGLWAPVKITTTPTGGSSTTLEYRTTRRNIIGRPDTTRIQFDLIDFDRTSSLMLNDSNHGKLNQDRLG